MPEAIINAMTIDVEDYFHVSAFADRISPRDWPNYESRVEQNTYRLMELLDREQVRATCFVLGWVAKRHPELIRNIAQAGHEVGCHSYWHRLVYDCTPDQFRQDTKQSRNCWKTSSASQSRCIVHRAFRLPPRVYGRSKFWRTWAFDVIPACTRSVMTDTAFPVPGYTHI